MRAWQVKRYGKPTEAFRLLSLILVRRTLRTARSAVRRAWSGAGSPGERGAIGPPA